VPGTELLEADGAPAFAATLTGLLAQPNANLGAAARAKVIAQYSWPSNLARIEARLECN
jgi:hypothetical protein